MGDLLLQNAVGQSSTLRLRPEGSSRPMGGFRSAERGNMGCRERGSLFVKRKVLSNAR